MSEDKRKTARTQGRYSDGDKEYSSRRQEKQSSKMPSSDKNKGEKRKAPVVESRAQNKMDLKFDDESKYSFQVLEPVKKPQELKFTEPMMKLSETDNGVSRLIYDPDFMKLAEADEYYDILLNSTKWHDKNIVIKGVEYPQPRLVAWYGPHEYTYAGATLEAREMPNTVLKIKERVEATLRQYDIKVELNSVLLNLYRNEKDSVAWHSDDELSLGVCPTIASVSLGETRRFQMRPKENVRGFCSEDVLYVNLTRGSLIVMDGVMQKDWQHRVPKEFHDKGQRINLTFRTIYPLDQLPPEMPYVSNVKSAKSSSEKVVHQQDPNFDAESFPPLGMEASEKKTKSLSKENGNKDYQQPVAQRKSPKGHWGASDRKAKCSPKGNNDKGHQKSFTQRKSQKEENWDDDMLVEDRPAMQNSKKSSHDQMIHSPELHPSQTDSNSSIEESSDFMKNEDYSNNPDTYQPSNFEPTNGQLFESKSPSKSKAIEIDEEHVDFNSNVKESAQFHSRSDAKTSTSAKTSRLNINAPVFLPSNTIQNKFEKCSMFDLIEYSYHLKNEDLHSFKEEIFKRIDANRSVFFQRDFYELNVYYELTEDGKLSDKHLKIILERIGSMVENAYHYPRHGNRYQNRSYDENNHQKRRQSYRRSQRY